MNSIRTFVLGATGITVAQNAFGALPIQRVPHNEAVALLRRAFEGGMRYFDTARAYSDSEEKLGDAFADVREQVIYATKTQAVTPDGIRADLETSLRLLRTDYVDIYQLHNVKACYRPGDGTGVYECLLDLKREGKIRHIGVSAHRIGVAEEVAESGLYETIEYPFSYLAGEREEKLVALCRERNVGFIAMKGLAGGLITDSAAAMAFIAQYDNVLPIWGIQREHELDEWLSYMENVPAMTEEIRKKIETERAELAGEFCRGCGYCMPCPAGITINQCARMSLMLRRAPSKAWLTDHWQAEMKKIEGCLHCGSCMAKCPYELNTPELLQKNYEDYQRVLAGEVSVW